MIGGPRRPPWSPADRAEVSVCRVAHAWWWPRFGAISNTSGRLFAATAREAREGPGGLAMLAGLTPAGEGFLFTPPTDAESLDGGAVFLPWGGLFNYGHFLLDALPSLLALQQAGLLDGRPALAPPLRPWQAGLLLLAFGNEVELCQTPAPVVRLGEVAFATSMDHHLNRPSALLTPLRARIRRRAQVSAEASAPRPGRLYLSRRSHAHSMRVMVNEAALERALRARGFTVVRPETLSAGRQAALMLDAEVIVGPTGAAMANAALAAPGARVIEIQPEIFVTNWVHAFSAILGLRYSVFFCPAPLPRSEAPLVRRLRRGFRFAYRLPLDAFLAFLDARL